MGQRCKLVEWLPGQRGTEMGGGSCSPETTFRKVKKPRRGSLNRGAGIRGGICLMRVLFVGQNGYGYPHTRVRCYNFARALREACPEFDTGVLSFRDDLCPERSEEAMYAKLRDRDKRRLVKMAKTRLESERDSLLVVQKAHFHAAAPYGMRKRLREGYLYDCDDYDVPLPNVFGRPLWNRWYFGATTPAQITEKIARDARGCIASSRWLVDWLSQYNQNVGYVPTGVDTERFRPVAERDPDRKITFFWNGIVWGQPIYENVSMAIRCFAKACERLKNVELLIVGEGAMWDRVLTDISQDADVPIRYEWAVAPDKMPEILQEVDVGLLPVTPPKDSQIEDWSAAKSPTKLFEYLASGLAVVASNRGEVTHVISDGEDGFLVDDEEAFVERLVQIAQDASLRERLGTAARETARTRYGLPVLGRKLGEFIKSLPG